MKTQVFFCDVCGTQIPKSAGFTGIRTSFGYFGGFQVPHTCTSCFMDMVRALRAAILQIRKKLGVKGPRMFSEPEERGMDS